MTDTTSQNTSSLGSGAINAGSSIGVLSWSLAVIASLDRTGGFWGFAAKLFPHLKERRTDFQGSIASLIEWLSHEQLSWLSARLLPTMTSFLFIVLFSAAARYTALRSAFNPDNYLISNRPLRILIALTIVLGFLAIEQSYFQVGAMPQAPEFQTGAGAATGHTQDDMHAFAVQCREQYALIKATGLDAFCVFMPGSPAINELLEMNPLSLAIVFIYIGLLATVVLYCQREVFVAFLIVSLVLLTGYVSTKLSGGDGSAALWNGDSFMPSQLG
jgi:hypothetical protein